MERIPAAKEPKSFDELLQNKDYQAEFDRPHSENPGDREKRMDGSYGRQAFEVDKLAKMNKEERAEYLRQKQERELKDREAAITRRELMAEAKEHSGKKKKLPVGAC